MLDRYQYIKLSLLGYYVVNRNIKHQVDKRLKRIKTTIA